jgi:hypothetical protein
MSAEPEFASLRQELLQSESHIITMTSFVMTVTGTSLAVAFQYHNPIAALFPLFVLHLGNVVVFNNVQTVALIGAYFHVFWEKENEEYHWETRQAIRRKLVEEEGINTRQKNSNRREEWMGPLAQRMFFVTGYVCIAVYAYAAFTVLLSGQSIKDLTYPHSWYIFLLEFFTFPYLLLVSLLIWTLKWRRSRKLTDPVHGSNSLMEQCRKAWNQVKDIESSRKVQQRKRKSENAA